LSTFSSTFWCNIGNGRPRRRHPQPV
jgi:hypothetical protein